MYYVIVLIRTMTGVFVMSVSNNGTEAPPSSNRKIVLPQARVLTVGLEDINALVQRTINGNQTLIGLYSHHLVCLIVARAHADEFTTSFDEFVTHMEVLGTGWLSNYNLMRYSDRLVMPEYHRLLDNAWEGVLCNHNPHVV
jgi:hypothetical protein